jgi:hypothetical protein
MQQGIICRHEKSSGLGRWFLQAAAPQSFHDFEPRSAASDGGAQPTPQLQSKNFSPEG